MRSSKSVLKRAGMGLLDGLTTVLIGFVYFLFNLQPKSRPFVLAPYVGHIVRSHLKQSIVKKFQTAFPGMSDGDGFRDFWKEHKYHVGLAVLEPLHLHLMDRGELSRHIEIDGECHLKKALSDGRGAMLFLNHLGNHGCLPAWLARNGYDITVAGNAMPVPYLERKVQRMYRITGAKRILLGDNLPARAAQTFRRNALFACYIDLSIANKHTEWFPFGPAEILQPIGPAIIALRNRVPVLYVSNVRLGENRHRLSFVPLEIPPSTGSFSAAAVQLTRHANALLSEDVRRWPEQWWTWDYTPVRPSQPARASLDPQGMLGKI